MTNYISVVCQLYSVDHENAYLKKSHSYFKLIMAVKHYFRFILSLKERYIPNSRH